MLPRLALVEVAIQVVPSSSSMLEHYLWLCLLANDVSRIATAGRLPQLLTLLFAN